MTRSKSTVQRAAFWARSVSSWDSAFILDALIFILLGATISSGSKLPRFRCGMISGLGNTITVETEHRPRALAGGTLAAMMSAGVEKLSGDP
jgi:hypothetical protein